MFLKTSIPYFRHLLCQPTPCVQWQQSGLYRPELRPATIHTVRVFRYRGECCRQGNQSVGPGHYEGGTTYVCTPTHYTGMLWNTTFYTPVNPGWEEIYWSHFVSWLVSCWFIRTQCLSLLRRWDILKWP